MCLAEIIQTGLDEEGEGWKVFETNDHDSLRGLFACITGCGDVYKPDAWYSDAWYSIYTRPLFYLKTPQDKKYLTGFHIILDINAAQKYMSYLKKNLVYSVQKLVLKKVKYRHAHTTGLEENCGKMVVAREMYICADEPAAIKQTETVNVEEPEMVCV